MIFSMKQQEQKKSENLKIPVEVSVRHIHLSKKDLEILFGKRYKLTKLKNLSTGTKAGRQVADTETLTIKSPKSKIKNVRIVGPLRLATQVELALTDARKLKIKVPLRISGNLSGSGKLTLISPKGKINLKEGVIIAKRHIHIEPVLASKFKLTKKNLVPVRIKGSRALIFNQVAVRPARVFTSQGIVLHLDTDEGNAAGIDGVGQGELII